MQRFPRSSRVLPSLPRLRRLARLSRRDAPSRSDAGHRRPVGYYWSRRSRRCASRPATSSTSTRCSRTTPPALHAGVPDDRSGVAEAVYDEVTGDRRGRRITGPVYVEGRSLATRSRSRSCRSISGSTTATTAHASCRTASAARRRRSPRSIEEQTSSSHGIGFR